MSITVYKLTTRDNKTRKGQYNECTWGPGVTHSGTGAGGLCGPGYIHAYLSPALAMFLNPIHANILSQKLWECSVDAIATTDNDLKVGALRLTTVREIDLPIISGRQRITFALLCAEKAQEKVRDLVTGNEPWQIKYRDNMAIFNKWQTSFLKGEIGTAALIAAFAAVAAATATQAVRAATLGSPLNLVDIANQALVYNQDNIAEMKMDAR